MQAPLRIIFYAPNLGIIDASFGITWDTSNEARLFDMSQLRFSIGYPHLPELLQHYINGTIVWAAPPIP